jgi:hypothetical protein
VRKVMRSEATEFRYERRFSRSRRSGRGARRWTAAAANAARGSARERLTLIRMFEDLRRLGYEGGYDAVRRYAAAGAAARGDGMAQAYVPLSFAPGEAYQFDWSHEIVLIAGVTVTVKVAHVRLCHSRMLFVRAYPRETQEMVFDAHDRAFAFFKGACTRGSAALKLRKLARSFVRGWNSTKKSTSLVAGSKSTPRAPEPKISSRATPWRRHRSSRLARFSEMVVCILALLGAIMSYSSNFADLVKAGIAGSVGSTCRDWPVAHLPKSSGKYGTPAWPVGTTTAISRTDGRAGRRILQA